MVKQKVIIMQGIPGSGKTTWARKFIKGKKKWIIINKDSIRSMLGQPWSRKLEELVKEVSLAILSTSLHRGYNVILDDVNISKNTTTQIEEKVNFILSWNRGMDIEIEYKVIEAPLWKAIYRDWKRSIFTKRERVGAGVIKNFHKSLKDE